MALVFWMWLVCFVMIMNQQQYNNEVAVELHGRIIGTNYHKISHMYGCIATNYS